MMYIKRCLIFIALTFGFLEVVQAEMVNFQPTDTVDYSYTGNTVGLSMGDIIFASGIYGDVAFTRARFKTINFNSSATGNYLNIVSGIFDTDKSNDVNWETGLSEVKSSNGIFIGQNDDISLSTNSLYQSIVIYNGKDDMEPSSLVTANWHTRHTNNHTIAVVPLPPAMWIFGSGLLWLFRIVKKNISSAELMAGAV